MNRVTLLFLVFFVLAGCTALPYDSDTFLQKATADVSLNSNDVRYHSRCEYGVTAITATSAVFQRCVYVQTDSEVILLGWDKNTDSYRKDLVVPFARINHAALNSFGLSRQLQLFFDMSQLAINLYPGGPSRQIEDTEKSFALMTRAGVKVSESRGWVRPSNGGAIPIFLPAK